MWTGPLPGSLETWRPGWLREVGRARRMQSPEEPEAWDSTRRAKATMWTRDSWGLTSPRLLQITWPSETASTQDQGRAWDGQHPRQLQSAEGECVHLFNV